MLVIKPVSNKKKKYKIKQPSENVAVSGSIKQCTAANNVFKPIEGAMSTKALQ